MQESVAHRSSILAAQLAVKALVASHTTRLTQWQEPLCKKFEAVCQLAMTIGASMHMSFEAVRCLIVHG